MFAENDEESVEHMAEVERLCEILTCDQLKDLNERLGKDVKKGRDVFLGEVSALNSRLEEERGMMVDRSSKGVKGEKGASKTREWSHDEQQLLIKAVNLFPAGTNQRWEVRHNVDEYNEKHY